MSSVVAVPVVVVVKQAQRSVAGNDTPPLLHPGLLLLLGTTVPKPGASLYNLDKIMVPHCLGLGTGPLLSSLPPHGPLYRIVGTAQILCKSVEYAPNANTCNTAWPAMQGSMARS